MTADRYGMGLALRESARAVGRTHPNPAVGCVVVRRGEVVGRGYTQPPPGPHAEVMALRMAGPLAAGATLYATLEPCGHHGRTPPCTDAISAAGVARVVIGARDPHPVAAGGLSLLRDAGIATGMEPLDGRVDRWLAPFLYWAATRRPYVVLKCAMTLDGKIASATGASRWITGPVARAYVHRLRRRLGAVMVGSGTALADDPRLTVRAAHAAGAPARQPARIVADTRLRLPLDSRLVRGAGDAPLIIACGEDADQAKIGALRGMGVEVLPLPLREGKTDFAILMAELGERGITGILLEGGGELAFSALETDSVREVLYFVAPRLLGGREAPSPLGGAGFASPAEGVAVHRLTARRCGPDWLFHGYTAAP